MEALHGEAPPSPTKHARVEVFSAKFLGTSLCIGEYLFGAVVLQCCDNNCVIFQCSPQDPPLITEGVLTLNGPDSSIPVKDKIVIYPWFIDLMSSFSNTDEAILWDFTSDCYDTCITRKISILFTRCLEIHFAAYSDAVEARLDVHLVDMEYGDADEPLRIHGTVSASSSVVSHPGAKSFLFHKVSGEYLSLKPDNSIALPLSRRMVVVPRNSALHVHVCLAIGSKSEDISVAENMVMFNGSSKFEEGCIIINCGKVSVKVWMECDDHDEQSLT